MTRVEEFWADVSRLREQMDSDGKVPFTRENKDIFNRYGVQVLYGTDYPFQTVFRVD